MNGNIFYLACKGVLVLLIFFVSCTQNEKKEQSNIIDAIAVVKGDSEYFEGGYAAMNQRGVRFFMDDTGKVPEHLTDENLRNEVGGMISSMDHFHDGFSVIMKNNNGGLEWGYVNEKGENQFGRWFEYAGEFSEGVAIVKDGGKWGAIDKNARFLISPVYEGLSDVRQDKGWVKQSGIWKWVSIPDMSPLLDLPCRIFGEESEGMRWVEKMTDDPEEIQRAFIDGKGRIISDWYSNASDFSEGLAAVERKGKWGFIDKTGKLRIPFSYGYASGFSEGLSAFTDFKDGNFGKWGYIDENGVVVISQQFHYATGFKEGMAEVRNNEGKVGFINKEGHLLIDYQLDAAYGFYEGLAAARSNDQWGFINKKGQWVIPPGFDKIRPFHDNPLEGGFSGGICKVDIDGHEFFISRKGGCVLGCLE